MSNVYDDDLCTILIIKKNDNRRQVLCSYKYIKNESAQMLMAQITPRVCMS